MYAWSSSWSAGRHVIRPILRQTYLAGTISTVCGAIARASGLPHPSWRPRHAAMRSSPCRLVAENQPAIDAVVIELVLFLDRLPNRLDLIGHRPGLERRRGQVDARGQLAAEYWATVLPPSRTSYLPALQAGRPSTCTGSSLPGSATSRGSPRPRRERTAGPGRVAGTERHRTSGSARVTLQFSAAALYRTKHRSPRPRPGSGSASP